MQRIGQNGGLCYGEQKANSYNSRKNSLKTFIVVVVARTSHFDVFASFIKENKNALWLSFSELEKSFGRSAPHMHRHIFVGFQSPEVTFCAISFHHHQESSSWNHKTASHNFGFSSHSFNQQFIVLFLLSASINNEHPYSATFCPASALFPIVHGMFSGNFLCKNFYSSLMLDIRSLITSSGQKYLIKIYHDNELNSFIPNKSCRLAKKVSKQRE